MDGSKPLIEAFEKLEKLGETFKGLKKVYSGDELQQQITDTYLMFSEQTVKCVKELLTDAWENDYFDDLVNSIPTIKAMIKAQSRLAKITGRKKC